MCAEANAAVHQEIVITSAASDLLFSLLAVSSLGMKSRSLVGLKASS
jgi:hypothetical protein